VPATEGALSTVSGIKAGRHVPPGRTTTRGRIHGVEIHEIEGVVTPNSIVVETWRREWQTVCPNVDQVIHVTMRPGAVSAWHLHQRRIDALMVVTGMLRVVVYDARPDSPTQGELDELTLEHTKPMLVVLPTAVWHGVQVLGDEPACFMNLFDVPYEHDDPDEWRLPAETDEVPYRFS
jgi:dTDP-4-dehydrorhamnose 3,5-epimerase